MFIREPNLPNGRVSLAAVSCINSDIIESLKYFNINIIKIFPYKNNTDNPEASHADMQLLHLGGRRLMVLKNNAVLNSEIIRYGFAVIDTESDIYDAFKYPQCVKLNCTIIGNNIIGNFKYMDRKVKSLLPNCNFINVNQGYAKCSTAIVSDNAVITSDVSIYNAAKENKIDCLKISEGHISLCDKYHGFIGGTCFKIDKNTLAFTGDITLHPDYINIKAFCKNYGVNLLSLTKMKLTDIGGIIPLKITDTPKK